MRVGSKGQWIGRVFLGVLFGMLSLDISPARSNPVEPLEADRSTATSALPINTLSVFSSPAGEHIIGYRRIEGVNTQGPLGAKVRADGDPFGPYSELTRTSNQEPLNMAFAPNGDGYAIWGIATSGASAEQTIRPAGQPFQATTQVTPCGRFPAAAASLDGRLSVACSFNQGGSPPNVFRVSILPELARVLSTTNVISAVQDTFIRPSTAWGADGTTVVAARHSLNTNPVPPSPEPGAITARIQSNSFTETSTVDASTNLNAMSTRGLAVLSDGTTVITGSKDGQARAWVRDPGSSQSFLPVTLAGTEAQDPVEDSQGFVHILSTVGSPQTPASVSIRSVGGLFGPDIPVPVTAPTATVNSGGFRVRDDGTAFVVMKDGGTVSIARRPAGALAFEQPVTVATGVQDGPVTDMTPEGDLLLAWTEVVDPNTRRLMVGGWDENPPAISSVQVPARGLVGGELSFSAEASDPMGLGSVRWEFGDGRTAEGTSVTHTYNRFGRFPVRVTATDRAGNQTVRNRTVEIVRGRPNPVVLRLNAPRRIPFNALARRGLRVVATGDRGFRVRAAIGTTPARAARSPIARRSVNAARIRQVVVIRPRRARLGSPRNFRLTLRFEATAADGGRTVVNRVVRVTRR